jgi:hypothetical protein
VKLEAACCKILWHVKDPLAYLRYCYTKFSILHVFLLHDPRCVW